MSFMMILEFPSLIDCFVKYGFVNSRGGMDLSGFPPFDAFLTVVSMG